MEKKQMPKEYEGQRLDKALSLILSNKSRTNILKMIENGDILVNDMKQKASYKIKEGDIVSINDVEIKPLGIEKENFPHHSKIDKRKNEVELCLHMFYEFSYKHDWIADTIVPWTQEWLFFYEIWLATNEWCGGGHTPVSYEE